MDLVTQMVKKVRKIRDEEMVKENTSNLVGLKEKLLCLSIISEFLSGTEESMGECWEIFGRFGMRKKEHN